MPLPKNPFALSGPRSGHVETFQQRQLLREAVWPRLKAEWQAAIDTLRAIMEQTELLESNPALKRSIRNRFPYLDPLNHLQIELLQRHRGEVVE